MISSRTKPRIQSSFASNSGSVEKSHAMAPPCRIGSRGNLPGVLEMVLTVGVLGFVGFRLASAAGHSFTAAGRSTTAPIVRGIRWRHVWPAPLVLIAVLVVATLLLRVPGLDWGWWTALGGAGNPVTGTTDQTAGTPLEWIVPLVFLTMLLPAIPLFALAEERTFRRGCEQWSWPRRVRRTARVRAGARADRHPHRRGARPLVRGRLLHGRVPACLPGAPRPPGGRAGSARAHAVYNVIIVVLVLITVVLIATGAASEP